MSTAGAAVQHTSPSKSEYYNDDDSDCCYEDLPPKQIWMTNKMNSSTASSVVSPLPDRCQVSSDVATVENINNNNHQKKQNKFNSKNLIASGHVWMGGMKLHTTSTTMSSTHHSGSTPALCTPDSTQTDTHDEGEDYDDDDNICDEAATEETGSTTAQRPVVTLGIGAAPFYGRPPQRTRVNGAAAAGRMRPGFSPAASSSSSNSDLHSSISSTNHSSSISRDDHGLGEEPASSVDDFSSIPSFSTRRIILDLQDELARTKAELAIYKNNNKDGVNDISNSTPRQDEIISIGRKAPKGRRDDSSDIAVVPAVVAPLNKKKFNTVITTTSSSPSRPNPSPRTPTESDAAAVLQVRLDRSEHRVTKLTAKLRHTNDLARRLHGTLQRVKDRMQAELLLPYEYHVEDVRFMNRCASLLLLAFVIVAPACFWNPTTLFAMGDNNNVNGIVDEDSDTTCYGTTAATTQPDLAAFALVVAVTFCAVEIAVRP